MCVFPIFDDPLIWRGVLIVFSNATVRQGDDARPEECVANCYSIAIHRRPSDEAELILSGHLESAGGKRWARTVPLRRLFNKSPYSPHISGIRLLVRDPFTTCLKSTPQIKDRLCCRQSYRFPAPASDHAITDSCTGFSQLLRTSCNGGGLNFGKGWIDSCPKSTWYE